MITPHRDSSLLPVFPPPMNSPLLPRLPLLNSSFLILTFLIAASSLAHGKKKSSGTFVPWKEIPAAVQSTIQTGAAGGSVKEVQKIPNPAGFIYCAEVKGTDGKWNKVYTTETGALMKVEPDKARNNRKHKPLFG
jgi:hypothetical protein